MKKIKFVLSFVFAFYCLFGSVYASAEIDIAENNESQIEEVEEKVIVVPITKDYVAYGRILSSAGKEIGKISIRANITHDPLNDMVIVNTFRGQIDSKTDGMKAYPDHIEHFEEEEDYQDGIFSAKRLIYTVKWYDNFGNKMTNIVELTLNSDGDSSVWYD